MKTNKAPEKLYVDTEDRLSDSILYGFTEKRKEDDIEYTRTDVFIEKACEYLQEHLIDYWSQGVTDESKFIDNFRNYMKGE